MLEVASVAVGVLQLSLYCAAILHAALPIWAFDLHTLPTLPPGSVPVRCGGSLSAPVKITVAVIGLQPSVTVYVYVAVQPQFVPVMLEVASVAVGVLQLSLYCAAIVDAAGAA